MVSSKYFFALKLCQKDTYSFYLII
jgi:ATP-dependent RNA helicase DOB1